MMELIKALLGTRRPPSTAVCPAIPRVKSLCFKRASGQGSALLTKNKSRIGHKCGMRKWFGKANWAAFVKYAKAEHKMTFFRAFTPVSRLELEGASYGDHHRQCLHSWAAIRKIQGGEGTEGKHGTRSKQRTAARHLVSIQAMTLKEAKVCTHGTVHGLSEIVHAHIGCLDGFSGRSA